MEFLTDISRYLADHHELIRIGGLAIILVIIYVETAFFIGLVVPGGDSFLFTVGLLAGDGFLDHPLWVLFPVISAASIAGDFTGYWQGRMLGDRLFRKEDTLLFKKSYLEKTKRVAQKFGVWSYILARFLPSVRTLMPLFAGATAVPLPRYAIYNATGGIFWVCSLVGAGYFLGSRFPFLIDYSGYIFLGIILFVSVPVVYYILRMALHGRTRKG